MNEQALENLVEAFQEQAIFNDYQAKNYELMAQLQELISLAWDGWSDDLTREHWNGTSKPEEFTTSFASQYLENEDFEEAGFSTNELNEFFAV